MAAKLAVAGILGKSTEHTEVLHSSIFHARVLQSLPPVIREKVQKTRIELSLQTYMYLVRFTFEAGGTLTFTLNHLSQGTNEPWEQRLDPDVVTFLDLLRTVDWDTTEEHYEYYP